MTLGSKNAGGRIIAQGIKTVPTGTAQPISEKSIPCRIFVVMSDSGLNASNTNADVTICVGDSEVKATDPGIRPNDGWGFDGVFDETQDPAEYYCISGTAGQKLSWWAFG